MGFFFFSSEKGEYGLRLVGGGGEVWRGGGGGGGGGLLARVWAWGLCARGGACPLYTSDAADE